MESTCSRVVGIKIYAMLHLYICMLSSNGSIRQNTKSILITPNIHLLTGSILLSENKILIFLSIGTGRLETAREPIRTIRKTNSADYIHLPGGTRKLMENQSRGDMKRSPISRKFKSIVGVFVKTEVRFRCVYNSSSSRSSGTAAATKQSLTIRYRLISKKLAPVIRLESCSFKHILVPRVEVKIKG